MPSNAEALALWLEGPMQSWGHLSKCDRRTTLSHPTQSGVVGILGAALGVARSDRLEIANLAGLTQEILVFGRPARWTDYHTVGGGYDPKENPQAIVPKDGKPGSTVQTWRDYLAEACFGVVLSGGAELLARCEAALRNPKWGVWLGRKCCIPSSPLSRGLHPEAKAAVECLEEEAGKRKLKLLRRISPAASFEDGTDTLHDVPLDFDLREFGVRRVKVTDAEE